MELTTETIKDISVRVVEDFINNKVPLNEGIAKQASEMELNSDQVKRVVEASNTIAYLKLQKEAEDKTFEFPVADYNHVLGITALGDTPNGDILAAETAEVIKTASATEEYDASLSEKHEWLRQSYFANKAQLEKLAFDKAELGMNMENAAAALRKDEYILEKLAEVCDEDTFGPMKIFLNIEKEAQIRKHVFRQAELSAVEDLVGMYKRAKELIVETEKREGLDKQASIFAKAGGIFKGVGQALGNGANEAVLRTFPGAPARALGMGVGATVGAAGVAAKGVATSKRIDPINAGFAMLATPKPSSNVWDNLQGTQKRF